MSAFDEFKNADGKTFNGVKAMASLTGLSEKSIVEIAAEVKANHKKLTACGNHEFLPSTGPTDRKRVCKNCGGHVDRIAAGWYEDGRAHEWAAVVREVGRE